MDSPAVHPPFGLAEVLVWSAYSGVARKLILQAKEQPMGAGAVLLRQELLAMFARRRSCTGPILAIPAGLHRWCDGWHFPSWLARELRQQQAGNFPRIPLWRKRLSCRQSGLSGAARRGNLNGCFFVPRRLPPLPRVWLVDDVWTTGATLQEAARALREAGVASVGAVVCARALSPDAFLLNLPAP